MTTQSIRTKLVQLGNKSDDVTGAVNPPVHFSTAYIHQGLGESTGYDYIRTKNPTRTILEEGIAQLESGDMGFACSSGMAAIQLVLSLFQPSDEIILQEDIYGGTYRLLEHFTKTYDVRALYTDFHEPNKLKTLITENTKAIFIETPTNPLMQEIDIQEVAKVAKQYNLLLIVDNTFLTPYIQRPIELGADIVIHSATKYIGGHNDVLAGLVVAKGETICDLLANYHNSAGAVLSPFDSWLIIRGMKTMALRLEKHEKNARKIAHYLENDFRIVDVFYPNKGGMLSFRIKNSRWIDTFLKNLNLIVFAESLGGVESFITYPVTQTHADIPEKERNKRGVCDRLLRFSVGIEEVEDLIHDLKFALDCCEKAHV